MANNRVRDSLKVFKCGIKYLSDVIHIPRPQAITLRSLV